MARTARRETTAEELQLSRHAASLASRYVHWVISMSQMDIVSSDVVMKKAAVAAGSDDGDGVQATPRSAPTGITSVGYVRCITSY